MGGVLGVIGGSGLYDVEGLEAVEEVRSMLQDAGYRVLDSDVQTLPRDPIIHFVKP